jgi:hypothetical protein
MPKPSGIIQGYHLQPDRIRSIAAADAARLGVKVENKPGKTVQKFVETKPGGLKALADHIAKTTWVSDKRMRARNGKT